MNYIQRLEHWGEAHHPKWLDFVRIALGLFLLLKGIEFANNMNKLMAELGNFPFGNFMMIILSHYVLFAHIFGGVLLTTGLLTRLACLIQIPILIGAIFTSVFSQFSEFSLAILVLCLLVYFFVIGSGRYSLDWYVNREDELRSHHEKDIY